MIVEGGIRTSLFQVLFEPRVRRLVERNQAALPELGGADHEPVRGDVLVSKLDGLGNAQTGAGQQCEEGTVSLSAQGAISRLGGQLNDSSDLIIESR